MCWRVHGTQTQGKKWFLEVGVVREMFQEEGKRECVCVSLCVCVLAGISCRDRGRDNKSAGSATGLSSVCLSKVKLLPSECKD